MGRVRQFTAVIAREDDGYFAHCPALDIASQGESVEQARMNLIEALTLFFETADEEEVAGHSSGEVFVTRVDVPVG